MFGNQSAMFVVFPMFFDLIQQQQQAARDLSYAQQLADRIDRVGFLNEQILLSVSTIALATAIPAPDDEYVDADGKTFPAIH